MKGLEISKDLTLPPETVTSALVVYGGRGMGKTNLGGVLVEELSHLGLRWVVADPVGVWWGLRHDKDGKGPGIECLILGGPHGDIPIEPTGGAVVADLVADESVNVIIDFSRKPNGEMWGVGEKIRFMTEYGKRLFQRQGSLVGGKRREPLMQVVDEAARFIPQTVRSGEAEVAKCMSIWAAIVEEGRNVGLGICLLTQRSARLSKDVAELADAMLAFRTIGPNSLDAVMDWLGEHVEKARVKELGTIVRSLPVGQCLVVSPGWLKLEDVVQIRMRHTFDSSATPKPGESVRRVVGSGAKPDLSKYAARMQETIERAKENDPAELRKKVRELTAQLLERPAGTVEVDREEVKHEITQAVSDAVNKRDNEWSIAVSDYRTRIINTTVEAMRSANEKIVTTEFTPPHVTIGEVKRATPVEASRKFAQYREERASARAEEPTYGNVKRSSYVPNDSNGGLKDSAVRALSVLASWKGKGLTEGMLAAQLGLKARGGGWNTLKRSIFDPMYAVRDGRHIKITTTGMGIAGVDPRPVPKTTEQVLKLWEGTLKVTSMQAIRELIRVYPSSMNYEHLGQLLNLVPRGGSWNQLVSELKVSGLVVKVGGTLTANKETLLL